jgi:hypothetical protein
MIQGALDRPKGSRTVKARLWLNQLKRVGLCAKWKEHACSILTSDCLSECLGQGTSAIFGS